MPRPGPFRVTPWWHVASKCLLPGGWKRALSQRLGWEAVIAWGQNTGPEQAHAQVYGLLGELRAQWKDTGFSIRNLRPHSRVFQGPKPQQPKHNVPFHLLRPVVPCHHPSSSKLSRIQLKRPSLPLSQILPLEEQLHGIALSFSRSLTANTMLWGSWPLHPSPYIRKCSLEHPKGCSQAGAGA